MFYFIMSIALLNQVIGKCTVGFDVSCWLPNIYIGNKSGICDVKLYFITPVLHFSLTASFIESGMSYLSNAPHQIDE